MPIRRGRRHQFTFDGKTIWLDSLTEAKALQLFVDLYGFSGKWARPIRGIKHKDSVYTPDFELAVNDFGRTARAIVEVKQYRRDLKKDIAWRMCVVADQLRTKHIYLYAEKKQESGTGCAIQAASLRAAIRLNPASYRSNSCGNQKV